MSSIRIQIVSALALLVLCITTTTEASGNSCPSSRPCERYSIQYFFKANWQRATEYCAFQGMRLASILNEADQATISYQLADIGMQAYPFWVSGNKVNKNVFTWSNGRPVTYTNWASGEPSGVNHIGAEECILMMAQQQKWNDYLCDGEFYFVCERV